jgi:hypothetical protein
VQARVNTALQEASCQLFSILLLTFGVLLAHFVSPASEQQRDNSMQTLLNIFSGNSSYRELMRDSERPEQKGLVMSVEIK